MDEMKKKAKVMPYTSDTSGDMMKRGTVMPYKGGATAKTADGKTPFKSVDLNGDRVAAAKRSVAVSRAKGNAVLAKLQARAAASKAGALKGTPATQGSAPAKSSGSTGVVKADKALAMRRDKIKKAAK